MMRSKTRNLRRRAFASKPYLSVPSWQMRFPLHVSGHMFLSHLAEHTYGCSEAIRAYHAQWCPFSSTSIVSWN
eukprot:3207649-Rhodomonas_salina.1